jgi:chemotaxis protein methyltransferase WspC
MKYSQAEALLRCKIGLDPQSIGSDAIARAFEMRMADCQISDIDTYLRNIQQSPQEWEALIDSIIIPETWFFRERESFKFLQQYVISEWLPKNRNSVLRILSVPCATGEEPYSIAIALREAGLTSANFHIDAIDISKKCLLAAQTGIYNQYSFRGNPLSFQERYFQATPKGYCLSEQVRHHIHFRLGNLAEYDFLAGTPPYHVIFCRNLLIYFDSATKDRTMKILDRLLSPDGLLFVGHGEAGLLLNSHFATVPYPLAFAYRKVTLPQSTTKPKEHKTAHKTSHSTHSQQRKIDKKVAPQSKPRTQPVAVNIKTHQPPSDTNLLDTAKALADEGRLLEAIELCNHYLSKNRVSVEAYVLLGQIQQAMGKVEDSLQSFQKAIYLQPTHQEALTHLALLRENQGDMVNANLLWQRIQRLQNI